MSASIVEVLPPARTERTTGRHAVAAPGPAVVPTQHLPSPPTDEEKYSYLGPQRRWPFVWLFLAQACVIVAFTFVMTHSPETLVGLVFLTFMVPPTVVNLWLRVRRRRVRLEPHVVEVERWRHERESWPSVDVFVPVCGEDLEVLDNTFRHLAALEWPGELLVHVLDDADDAGAARLAASHGFDYVVRPNRGEWKKAGNMIHAFDTTGGEFIAVFDADFAPRTDFLFETVPYMDDPRIGIIQTAQYFDVDGRVNEFARYAGVLQEMFFRWVQPARDTFEAAICAGTNLVYRRAAVVAAGGFAKVPLGEDVHSGVKLWVANYRTRYLPMVLAKGLAPDSWKALTNQQYRWCRSSMLIMISSIFRSAPFSWKQRVAFWAAFLYYMSSAALLVTSSLPTLIMLWFYPDEVRPEHYLLMVPSLLSTLLVFPLLMRGYSFSIYRVTAINSFCHVAAVYDAVRGKVAAWVPTGATKTKTTKRGTPERVALIGRVWFVVVQSLLWAAIVRHVVVGDTAWWVIWPAIALAALQFLMLAPLLLTLRPRPATVAPAPVTVAATG